jgi:alpha-L-fucosidase
MKKFNQLFRNFGFMANVMTFLVCLPGISFAQQKSDRSKHQLPSDNGQYQHTIGYVEDNPVPEYKWASEKAYEDFQDMKYGVRIHWGLYSIIRQEKESWPLLKKSNSEKQAYFDNYKTWNPVGFNANEWMNLPKVA